MTDKQLENMKVFRKAQRCATLFELLAEQFNLDPLSPKTTWGEVAKAYSITMEEAHKLQQLEENENTND